VINQDLIDRGFTRAVVILDESVRTQAIADRRARREYAGRNRSLDRLSVVVDGLSYVEGGQALPWAQDTTADVVAWDLGGALGSYYIEEVEMTRSPADGDRTRLVMVRQGVWVL
jgi:prophage tail gpP-like protein